VSNVQIENYSSGQNNLLISYNVNPGAGCGGGSQTNQKTLNQTNILNSTIEEIKCSINSAREIKQCIINYSEYVWPDNSLKNFLLFILILTGVWMLYINRKYLFKGGFD